ncbi:MAG: hypothetical protein AAFO95_06530 [Cyanobacteria bacterium J06600_6]
MNTIFFESDEKNNRHKPEAENFLFQSIYFMVVAMPILGTRIAASARATIVAGTQISFMAFVSGRTSSAGFGISRANAIRCSRKLHVKTTAEISETFI